MQLSFVLLFGAIYLVWWMHCLLIVLRQPREKHPSVPWTGGDLLAVALLYVALGAGATAIASRIFPPPPEPDAEFALLLQASGHVA
ncbi:MAG: hypothetical protein N2C14_12140, partial [Planctomycetales bacterium]